VLEHEMLEEQHGCHSPVGTNDGISVTTAVEAKDERRRQEKQFNKTEVSTKVLDASRIWVAPATQESAAPTCRLANDGRHDAPRSCSAEIPHSSLESVGESLLPWRRSMRPIGWRRVRPPRRPVPPYCGSTKVLPFFFALARKETGGSGRGAPDPAEDTSSESRISIH